MPKQPVNKFLQNANVKEGLLHKKLQVPQEYNMGDMMTFLKKIDATPVGHVCKNPLAHGIPEIMVDAKLHKEVRFAMVGINSSRGVYKKKPAAKKPARK